MSWTSRAVCRGDLYLRGGGDPTFGTRRSPPQLRDRGQTSRSSQRCSRRPGSRASRARVRRRVAASTRSGAGPSRATRLRSGSVRSAPCPSTVASATSPAARSRRTRPLFAAARLDAALEARGVRVRLKPRAGVAPADAEVLASVDSPPMGTPDPAHQQAVRQLLRRDAPEGPRPAGAWQRARPHGRPGRRRLRPATRLRRAARGRLRGSRAPTAPRRGRS